LSVILILLLSQHILMISLGKFLQCLHLLVAAAEAAIGLAILVVFFRNLGSIEVNKINQLKG